MDKHVENKLIRQLLSGQIGENDYKRATQSSLFKVGTRVRALEPRGGGFSAGTILNTDSDNALVVFDAYVNGHAGDGRAGCKAGHCWWVLKVDIEILEGE